MLRILFSMCLATMIGSGCASTLLMDTGRSLPGGATSSTWAVGAGYPVMPEPKDRPLSLKRTSTESENSVENGWPIVPGVISYRGKLGLGEGIQADLSINLPVYFIALAAGGSVGLKWQVPLQSQLELALLSRAGFQGIGSSGASWFYSEAEGGLIASFNRPSLPFVPYLSPRVRIAHLRITQAGFQNAEVAGYSWIGSIGVFVRRRVYVEASGQYSPRQPGFETDRFQFLAGAGITFGE